MKPVMDWIKRNWVVVVLTVVAVAALPTMVYVSTRMSNALKDDMQKRVAADWKDVGNSKVTYSLPSIIPGQTEAQQSTDVNAVLTKYYRDRRQALMTEAGKVAQEAIAFNKGSHTLLVQGLFPEPAELQKEFKPLEMAKKYVGPAHVDLLAAKGVGAAKPLDSKELATQLNEYAEQRMRTLKQGGGGLTPDEQVKLTDEVMQQRIGRYKQHAMGIHLYADPGVFLDVPQAAPNTPPSLRQCWDWQERYWIHQDLVGACAKANAGSDADAGVPASVVMRIVSIRADAAAYGDASGGAPEGGGNAGLPGPEGGESAAPAAAPDLVPVNKEVSVTGRSGGTPQNQFYDVRTVQMVVIVSSERLPQLFDALAATNYMTVLKLDLDRVEPLEDLREGYYYGDEHVVRATLKIETIWLREWTREWMPKVIKTALGVIEPAKPAKGPG